MSSQYKKWTSGSIEDGNLLVVLFISRNKDNKEVEFFKERRESFVISSNSGNQLMAAKMRFHHFVESGVRGEMSRMYISVNARDRKKTMMGVMHELLDRVDSNCLPYIESIVAGVAARKENAAEHCWMFDWDGPDSRKNDFIKDIVTIDDSLDPVEWKTPNGWAILVTHGFDTRELMEKYAGDVALKRDDLLCYDWRVKNDREN